MWRETFQPRVKSNDDSGQLRPDPSEPHHRRRVLLRHPNRSDDRVVIRSGWLLAREARRRCRSPPPRRRRPARALSSAGLRGGCCSVCHHRRARRTEESRPRSQIRDSHDVILPRVWVRSLPLSVACSKAGDASFGSKRHLPLLSKSPFVQGLGPIRYPHALYAVKICPPPCSARCLFPSCVSSASDSAFVFRSWLRFTVGRAAER
jgi:hypothetical protein